MPQTELMRKQGSVELRKQEWEGNSEYSVWNKDSHVLSSLRFSKAVAKFEELTGEGKRPAGLVARLKDLMRDGEELAARDISLPQLTELVAKLEEPIYAEQSYKVIYPLDYGIELTITLEYNNCTKKSREDILDDAWQYVPDVLHINHTSDLGFADFEQQAEIHPEEAVL